MSAGWRGPWGTATESRPAGPAWVVGRRVPAPPPGPRLRGRRRAPREGPEGACARARRLRLSGVPPQVGAEQRLLELPGDLGQVGQGLRGRPAGVGVSLAEH